MLSYQHIYHAGNPADVHKHASLSVILTQLTKKEKPLTYIETHAGRGIYDLSSEESQKTGEAKSGILSFLNNPKIPQNHPYFSLEKRIQNEIGENIYAGSPFIAEALLRPTDVLHLMELHPQEYQGLYKLMRYPNTHLHHRDGYEGALAISPPTPRRGIVFIDPSYEVKAEYEKVANFALKLHKKWAEATILIWHPVLKENHHQDLIDILVKSELPKLYKNTVQFEKGTSRMAGSGLISINTPYGAEEELNTITSWF